METTLSEFLGRLVADTRADDVADAALERTKVSLLHNFAVALAGRRREQVAYRIAETAYGVPAQATLLHNGRRSSVEGAAFANGALFHARSQDDTHPDSTSHPGAPVMAAALAVAEERGVSGAEFLHAVILGYEALCRIGRDFDEQVTGRGYRAAGVFGVFGATAAAARLLRLDAGKTAHALGLATHMAGGLSQVWQEGSAEFPLQLGFAAKNGIVAARAASLGATAARRSLDGPKGFFNAYAGVAGPAEEAYAHTGVWQIEEATVKPYPACAILQGPLQLVCDMLRTGKLSADEVVELSLELNPYEARYTGIDNEGPFASATATKMSAQFCLGNALERGGLALSDLENVSDASALRQAAKVRVVENTQMPQRLCRIRLRTVAGEEIERMLDVAVGRPDPTQIRSFALDLSSEIGTPRSRMERLADEIDLLGEAGDVFALLSAVKDIVAPSP